MCVECGEGECCGMNMSGDDDIVHNCVKCFSDESKCEECEVNYSLNKEEKCIEKKKGKENGGGMME